MENANPFVPAPPNGLRARITQDLNEFRAISAIINYRLKNIDHTKIIIPPIVPFEQLLNDFMSLHDVFEMDELESDNESTYTPLVSPFINSDEELDDEEVLNELNEYGNTGNFYPNRRINCIDRCDLAFPCMIGTDKAKTTRKRLKPGKHEHKERKSTKEARRKLLKVKKSSLVQLSVASPHAPISQALATCPSITQLPRYATDKVHILDRYCLPQALLLYAPLIAVILSEHRRLLKLSKYNRESVIPFYTSAGNLVKEILLKLNLPDHRSILTDSKMEVKLKNFKKDVILKLFKLTYQERYEHVGPEVTSSQDGEVYKMEKGDYAWLMISRSSRSHSYIQVNGTSSCLKSMITTSIHKLMNEVKDYELKTKVKA
ncbi:hypothetical protein Tco_0361020 [Tanacetum coccineum]